MVDKCDVDKGVAIPDGSSFNLVLVWNYGIS